MRDDPPLPLSAFRGYFVETLDGSGVGTVLDSVSDAPSILVVAAAPFRFLRLEIPVESVIGVDATRRCIVIAEPPSGIRFLTAVAGFLAAVAHDLRTALRSSRR